MLSGEAATGELPKINRALKPVKAESNPAFTGSYQRKFAICIGINKYSEYTQNAKGEYDLTAAVSDAERMARFFKESNFCQVVLLKDKEATKDRIIEELEKVKAVAGKDDLLVFYFAGHGIVANKTYHSYLIPFDCLFNGSEDQKLDENGISLELLKEITLTMNNYHILLLLDCCYSGSVDTNRLKKPDSMPENEFMDFVANRCIYALFASGITQPAQEKRWAGGVFTDSILRGLNGHMDNNADANKDGKVLVRDELIGFVREDVSKKTQGMQKPEGEKLQKTDGDIMFDLNAGAASNKATANELIPAPMTPDEIKSNYSEVLKLQKNNTLRQAGILMIKVYLAYCALPKKEQMLLLRDEKDQPKERHAEFLEKLGELSWQQISQLSVDDKRDSALASYYSGKCLKYNPSPFSESIAYCKLGAYNYSRGYYNTAEILLKKGVILLKKINDEDKIKKRDDELLVCFRLLGMSALQLYKYEDAREYLLEQSKSLAEKYKDDNSEDASLERARLYNDIGCYYIETGGFSDAEYWLGKSLKEYKSHGDENRAGVAEVYHNFGRVALHNADVFQALRHFKSAIAINEELFGTDSVRTISSLLHISNVYLKRKELKDALKYALKAKNIAYHHYSPEHPVIAEIDSQLGLVYMDEGKYSIAEYFLKKALAVSQRRFGQHPKTAYCYKNLGMLYRSKQYWQKSIECLNKAREIQQEFLTSAHYVSVSTADALKETESMKADAEIKRKEEEEKIQKDQKEKEKSWLNKISP
ncbi:MAG: tetratricopeptide repeat protein [Lentisphaerota bacterium]